MDVSIYQPCHDAGGMSDHTWAIDPKRLAFVLARYKHTAKLLAGYDRVLEVGCADGWASRIVAQHVGSLDAIDIDVRSIVAAHRNESPKWPISYRVADIMDLQARSFDAVYALDVLEHIEPDKEGLFLHRMRRAAPVAVIGMPSLESQVHASPLSRAGHVNCKSGEDLKATLARYWKHVFVFSMNDETLHTGFYPMANYLLALACEPIT